VWTVVGLTGSIVGLVGLVVMWWLRRDAERYAWAVGTVITHPQLALLKRNAQDDVSDAKGLLLVAGILFLIVVAMTGAGFAALFGQALAAIPLLVASEVLVVVSVAALVVLGYFKMRRRNAIRNAVRLNRTTTTP
jgi:hypothetical protein